MIMSPFPRKRPETAIWLLIVLAVGGCARCQSDPEIHAQGTVGGQAVSARVDSRLAEYYIEDYSRGDRHDSELNQQLSQIARQLGSGVPDRESLEYITSCYSRDVATIFLVERLANDPINQHFNEAYEHQLSLVTGGQANLYEPTLLKSDDVVFLVVPGWYWRDRSYDGNLAAPRQYLTEHGYHTELLPTDDQGSVECNAQLVALRLRQLQRSGKLVVLVSVSKGSAEAALALGHLLSWDETQHVMAWINVNGGLRGSPLADELLSWRRKLITRLGLWIGYGDNGAGLKSMRTELRRATYDALQLPPNLMVVNFTAIPFSGQVTPRSHGYDKLLNKHGPHDGSLLSRDELVDNAPTVVEVGFDHYFFDPMIGPKALALVRALEEQLVISPTGARIPKSDFRWHMLESGFF